MQCRHKAYLAPYFQSPQKMEKVMDLYEAIGKLDKFETENLSLVVTDKSSYFGRHVFFFPSFFCFGMNINIEELLAGFNRESVSISTRLSTVQEFPDFGPREDDAIYVGIDPSGGGTSYAAFTAIYFSKVYFKYFVSCHFYSSSFFFVVDTRGMTLVGPPIRSQRSK